MTRALARRNPASQLGTGIFNTVIAAGAGAGIGAGGAAVRSHPIAPSIWTGAEAGLGVAMIGGIFVALVSPTYRNAALATTGFSFVALFVTGIADAAAHFT